MIRALLALVFVFAGASANADLLMQGVGPRGPNPCSAWVIPGGNLFNVTPDPNFNTGWSWNNGAQTVNSVFTPACSTNGTVFVPNAVNTSHGAAATLTTAVTAGAHTFNMFAKRVVGSLNIFPDVVNPAFTSSVFMTVDLGTCSVSVAASSNGTWTSPSGSAYPYANGWCRITITATMGVDTGWVFNIFTCSGTTCTYAGDGTSSIGYWGAEIR